MGSVHHDAIVIGAGHNGLVCAAYLARAGLSTLLVEARETVGGTATSEPFAGAIANICNCDHLTFRTTPVMDELDLGAHGLRYLDVEPAQFNATWSGDPAWASYHDVEATIESIARHYPADARGYRRYLRAALPAVRMVFDAARQPPTVGGLAGIVARNRGRGATTLARWSRMSAADVVRRYFSHEALRAPVLATGPMVWGLSPETPGTGLGALTYAMRHVGQLGRPVGGSGRLPDAIASAFHAAGGTLRLGAEVAEITCDDDRVRGVRLADGEELSAAIVVSACNPHDTFLRWLRDPPASAQRLIERWRRVPHAEGYESKIDAIVADAPRLRSLDDSVGDDALAATMIVAPTLAEMDRAAALAARGEIIPQPVVLANTPSVLDPSVAAPDGHVFSLETLFTPYRFAGNWRAEAHRWMREFSTLVQPGFLDGLGEWRVLSPTSYEREFFLPRGHATSFAGGPLAAVINRNPELTRYATAVRGLYLTGAATFPGAGVWGASGRNAALTILRRV